MASSAYIPPHPPRGSGPVPVWRGLFGERMRNAIYGWSERAFRDPYILREVFGFRVHVPLEPAMVQHVLLDYAANYIKPRLIKQILDPTIGDGLLMADRQLWRDQRRIVAGTFTPPAVDALIPDFARAAKERAARWPGGLTDMAEEATATTQWVIADTLFGGDPRLKTAAALRHITAAMDGVTQARLPMLLGLPVLPITPKLQAGRRGVRFLRDTLAAVLRDRRAGGGPDDFLGRLIAALNAQYPPDRAAALALDNAATFYLAGHETTANAVTWTLFLLAEQPDWQERVRAEARAALPHGQDDAALPERLPLLRQVLEEALRLYPPVPRLDREAVGADQIGGHEVRPGDIVSIWPWLLQRHRALWDEPDAFRPERFAAGETRHRFQYIPFGAGPRVCVGQRFATVEALVVLAHWLARHSFRSKPGWTVRPGGMVTLRPQGGLPLIVERAT